MSTFNLYDDLIEPLGLAIKNDRRFEQMRHVYYDRTETKIPAFDMLPCINYFLETPWDDVSRGSGSYSFRTREMSAHFGFGIWVCEPESPARTDHVLFSVGQDLQDLFWERRDFSVSIGILPARAQAVIEGAIRWDVAYMQNQNVLVGAQKFSVSFKLYGPP